MNERPRTGHGHEQFADDLAAYALDALAEPDATRLERHLEDCAACQAELRWLRGAVDVLPESVEQLEPPSRLRRRILKEVRSDGQEPAAPRATAQREPSWRGLIRRPATALAAVLLVLAGIVAGYLVRGGGEPQSTIALRPTAAAPGAQATLERVDESASIDVRRMPALPRGKVYEVWVQHGTQLKPSSIFVLRRDGSGEAAIAESLNDADHVLVTREPHGGSRQPTSPVLLRARLD
jgi:hypothetical protein